MCYPLIDLYHMANRPHLGARDLCYIQKSHGEGAETDVSSALQSPDPGGAGGRVFAESAPGLRLLLAPAACFPSASSPVPGTRP